MWRLTIYQKFNSTHEIKGEEIKLDGEHPVSFESEDINNLCNVIDSMSEVDATEETRYEIRKVVD